MAQVANVDFVTGEVSSPAINNITPHGRSAHRTAKRSVEAIGRSIDARSYQPTNVRNGERNFRCTTDKVTDLEAGRRYTFVADNQIKVGGGEYLRRRD